MNGKFVVVDIETTGNNPTKIDKIIQIGAVLIHNGVVVKRFSSFVNPEMSVPPFIEQLTGISDDMLTSAPTFSEIAPTILNLLDGAYFVAHNVPFDLGFLQTELSESGYNEFNGPTLDTVELSRILYPSLDGYKLSQLADQFSIIHENPHQADSDAGTTAELLLRLLRKLEELPLTVLQKLSQLVKNLKSDLDEIITSLISKKMHSIHEMNEDKYDIYRGFALKKKEEILERTEKVSIEFKDVIEGMKNSSQNLKRTMSSYEVRVGQLQMMEEVYKALQEEKHLLAEAGTGIGKTLAYLVPAIHQACVSEEPFVISTYTVQLQQQIIDRDIPVLQSIFPFIFRATVLKGRNHYLCLRKFEHHFHQLLDDNYDTSLTKAQLLIWLTETSTGDVDELNLSSGGRLFWLRVQSEAEQTFGIESPWFSRCFYQRARRSAQKADIIVTNHALLLTDLTNENPLLPNYKNVILDEAHHFDETAGDLFGTHYDYPGFMAIINRLGTIDGTEILGQLFNQYENDGNEKIRDLLSRLNNCVVELKHDADEMFRMLRSFCLQKHNSGTTEVGRISYKYDPKHEEGPLWEALKEVALRIKFMLKDCNSYTNTVIKLIDGENENQFAHVKNVRSELKRISNVFDEFRNKIQHLLFDSSDDEVYWIEVAKKGAVNSAYLYSQPIKVGDELEKHFFNKKKSVILTSATLSVNGSFTFIKEKMGMKNLEVNEIEIPSPFDYKEQVKVMVPSDLPKINEVSQLAYIQMISKEIIKIAEVTKGRMLVLFTSYDMLKQTFYAVKEEATNEQFVLIGQGISSGSRAKLTKNFKQFDHSILFGTSSFWEGVDIPGEDLSCLVIVRLPFSPPDNPVMVARSEKCTLEGGNPFMELSLPQAIIRFKQGFGRLIRTSGDKGAVFVFDKRIMTARYGKKFIRALPEVPVYHEPSDQLVTKLKEWM